VGCLTGGDGMTDWLTWEGMPLVLQQWAKMASSMWCVISLGSLMGRMSWHDTLRLFCHSLS
jgi:hypothetical protein